MILKLMVLLLVTAPLSFEQSARHRHRSQARPIRPHSSSKRTSTDIVRLTEKLRGQGATVAITKEKISQPFFSVPGRIVKVNGEALQVFEYATPSAADADASRVSTDGTTIGTSKPSWMAPPHFFKSEKFLVLYVGGNQTVLNVLRGALGSQFAGA